MADANFGPAEERAVLSALKSKRLSMGSRTQEFERVTAEYCGAAHGIAVNSGTAGLHLLANAAGIASGDEVITTSFSFVASTNCFLYLGAQPVFVDIEPETYCLDPHLIEAAITPKTKAIVAVDVFGHPADWERITALAEKHGLRLIADACESLGAEYKGRKTGPFGCGGVFAYFPNKQVTTGEGGMIVTDEPEIARACKALRNQGRDEGDSWLGHTRLGYNYRMDELSAALGVAQMARIDELLQQREEVAATYSRLLASESRVKTPRCMTTAKMSFFVYVIELRGDFQREDVMRGLEARGIPSRGYFTPIHHQPYMQPWLGGKRPELPVTDYVATKTVALPYHAGLSESDLEYVVEGLREVLDDLS